MALYELKLVLVLASMLKLVLSAFEYMQQIYAADVRADDINWTKQISVGYLKV